jgi:hypothetical protein
MAICALCSVQEACSRKRDQAQLAVARDLEGAMSYHRRRTAPTVCAYALAC